MELQKVDTLVAESGSNPEALIGILQDIQEEWHYLPVPALKRVAECLDVPFNRVWAVATFYEAFTLEPRGKTHIMVCTGTACHVRGAGEVVRALEEKLGIESGHTTPDGEFSIESAHCLGACAMGPVVVARGEYHGHVTRNGAGDLLEKLKSEQDGDEE